VFLVEHQKTGQGRSANGNSRAGRPRSWRCTPNVMSKNTAVRHGEIVLWQDTKSRKMVVYYYSDYPRITNYREFLTANHAKRVTGTKHELAGSVFLATKLPQTPLNFTRVSLVFLGTTGRILVAEYQLVAINIFQNLR
jgi:hypothetical protein